MPHYQLFSSALISAQISSSLKNSVPVSSLYCTQLLPFIVKLLEKIIGLLCLYFLTSLYLLHPLLCPPLHYTGLAKVTNDFLIANPVITSLDLIQDLSVASVNQPFSLLRSPFPWFLCYQFSWFSPSFLCIPSLLQPALKCWYLLGLHLPPSSLLTLRFSLSDLIHCHDVNTTPL